MPQFNKLNIPNSLVEEIIEHGRDELPNECCGLLAGRIAEDVGIATRRYVIKNDAASSKNYRGNARDMLDAFRSMREEKLELLAIYHSHPGSEPVPSLHDIEQNAYGECVVHLILSLAGSEPAVRAWWLSETGYRDAELRILYGP
jgi:proteasome lid subunit RPN8/RPN11